MSQVCEAEELDPHELNDCFFPKGGIPSMGVLKTGHGITDFSNATQVQAAIDAGKLIIFDRIKATLAEPAAVEGENVTGCSAETIVDGFNYELAIKDFNVNANNDLLIKQLNSSSFEGIILFLCDQNMIRVALKSTTFIGSIFIPETKKDKQYYPIKAKWYQSVNDELPALYDAPEGIFFQTN